MKEKSIKRIEQEIQNLAKSDIGLDDGRDDHNFFGYKRFCQSSQMVKNTLKNIQDIGREILTEEQYNRIVKNTPSPINWNLPEETYNYTIRFGLNIIKFLKNGAIIE